MHGDGNTFKSRNKIVELDSIVHNTFRNYEATIAFV